MPSNSYPDDPNDPYSVDAPGVDAPGLNTGMKNASLGISAYNMARNLGVGLPSLGIPGMAISAALNAALQAERDRDVLGYTKTTLPGQLARSVIPGPLQRGILGQLGQLGPYQQAVYDKAPLSQLQDAAKQTQYQHMYTPEEQSLMSKSELGWDYDIADPDPSLSVAGVEGVKGVTMDSDEFGLDDWSGPTTVDSETSYGYGVQGQTDDEELGQATADAQEDEESGFGESSDWNEGGYVGYDGGGFNNAELINEKLKRTYGDQAFVKQTPNYSELVAPGQRARTIRVPPGSMPIKGGIPVGIEVLQGYGKRLLTKHPAAVMKRYNLKNQKLIENKQTSIKAKYKFSDVPDFMAKTLIKLEEVRASHTSSEEEVTNENAEKLRRVAKSFGVGTTFTLSPENLKALVNLDFSTGLGFRNISGNVGIPLSEDTRVNVGARRNLIEGGKDSTSYDAGLNTKVFGGIGKLGINVRKTDQDNYIGGKLTFPLGPTPKKSTIEERHFYNAPGPYKR